MEAVNANLPDELKLEQADLDVIVAQVAEVNAAIDAAPTPDAIGGEVAKSPVATPALTLKRDDTLLRYYPEGVNTPVEIDLDSFESNTLTAGSQYATTISGSGVLSVDKKGFMVDKSLTNKRVDLGFSVVATGDNGDARTLSIATTKARVSRHQGQRQQPQRDDAGRIRRLRRLDHQERHEGDGEDHAERTRTASRSTTATSMSRSGASPTSSRRTV